MTIARSKWPYELAALVLLALYINAFEVWRWLSINLGPGLANVVPIAVAAAAVVAALSPLLKRGLLRKPSALVALLGTGLLVVLALLASDSAFPAKRIHVAEYLLMGLVIRPALKDEFHGTSLLWATALITALIGCHDELIQGLYPNRSFGWRDIGINALSGLAGALIGYGLTTLPRAARQGGFAAQDWMLLAPMGLGWLALLYAIPQFRGVAVPLWTALPLAGGVLATLLLRHRKTSDPGYFLSRVSILLLATLLYPLLTHATTLAFH